MTAFSGYYIPQFATTTLNVGGGITNSQTTGIILASVPSDIDITKPGIICMDYASPLVTSTAEWMTYTSIDGTNTLQGVVRGQEGFSAKAHLNGAAVAWVVSKSHINQTADALTGVTTGVSLNTATLTTPTITTPAITTPKITTSINDSGGNEIIKTPATASAVNEITVTNAAASNAPQISATGDDTNIDLKVIGKGSGKVVLPTNYGAITTDTDGATITFDCSVTNRHQVVLGGSRTLALSNYSTGQMILLDLIQDSTGSRTVTWFVGSGLTVTMTIAAPGVVTSGADIPTGTPVVFTNSGGALPTGITAGTTYWWVRQSSTTGNVSTSLANAQAGTYITTSGSQSGTHTMKCSIRWPSQTAPTLSTGKFVSDTIGIYVKDATAGVFQGYTVGQAV